MGESSQKFAHTCSDYYQLALKNLGHLMLSDLGVISDFLRQRTLLLTCVRFIHMQR